jgi:hypothetical protein
MSRLWRVLIASLAVAVALVLVGLGYLWSESDAVLRRLGFSAASERLVTGILVTGAPGRPVVYVTSSDPRIGEGLFDADDSLDTNSGVLSRLVLTRRGWEKTDLIRGLPRSNLDHATNGMALSADGTTLYIAQGGNTNQGAPSTFFNAVPEYALAAAILAVDLVRLGDRTYDLPTLDDPDRSGQHDENDPFGGNKGLNQARLVPGSTVQVFASGLRNPYDVAVTERGRMYTFQNGPDPEIGGLPEGEGPEGECSNELRDGGRRGADTLHLVAKGGYYGHPNPSRAECDYVLSRDRGALLLSRSSTNGIAEYTASNLDGRLRGNLVVVSLRGEVTRLVLSQDGNRLLRSEVLTRLAAPLDVTTQGDEDPFPGTIWVAQYAGEYGGAAAAGSPIAVLDPHDYGLRGWSSLPSAGHRRQEVSLVAAEGRLHLAGGTTRHQAYDPKRRRWSDLTPLPERLDHIQGVRVGKRIFYIGGLDRLGEQASSVFVYDPATDSFSRGAPMPRARGAGGVVAHEGKVYYAGGLQDGRAVPWLDVYDPARDRWSQLRDMPRPRDHFQAVVVDGVLYAIGGRQGRFGSELGENDAYDFATGSWRDGFAPIPTRRGGYAAAAMGHTIYVIGGETPEAALSTVEAYDTRADSWRVVEPMPTPRHGIQAAVCAGGIFVAAGGTITGAGAPSDALEVLSPDGVPPCGISARDVPPTGDDVAPALKFGSLEGAQLTNPTSLQFGPDGRLYVAQQDGLITALTVARRGAGDYRVTAAETISLIQSIPNHDDDGSAAADFSRAFHELAERLKP